MGSLLPVGSLLVVAESVETTPVGDFDGDGNPDDAVPLGDDATPDGADDDEALGLPDAEAEADPDTELDAVDDGIVPGWSASMIAMICCSNASSCAAIRSTGTSPAAIDSPYLAISCHSASSFAIAPSESGPSSWMNSCFASA